jgi:DNA-directed RNA polymerase specialized sigma24 family protein
MFYANDELDKYDDYIRALVQKIIPTRFGRLSSNEFEMEIDEVAQRVRIKFWQALQKRHIDSPKTYIRCIINSECIDLARQHKPTVALSFDEEGELYLGHTLLAMGEHANDPEMIVEQEERLLELLKELLDIVRHRLPRRQREAFLCGLIEKIDDYDMLVKTLEDQQINLDEVPVHPAKAEQRTLQASRSQARRTIARYMQAIPPAYRASTDYQRKYAAPLA